MDDTPCSCALRCYEKVSGEQRRKIFSGFWDTADFNVQNAYICGCVKVIDIAKRYTARGAASHRSSTRVYYVSNGQVSVRVWKVAFLRLHGVSNGRLNRALKAQMANAGSPRIDLRGRHVPVNKTSDADIQFLKEHIESFPMYESLFSN